VNADLVEFVFFQALPSPALASVSKKYANLKFLIFKTFSKFKHFLYELF
jgi:hypothetical protein